MKIRHLLVPVIFILVLTCSALARGDKKGNVGGVVEGPGGTLLANAEVTLTNKAGGEPLTTQADDDGEFIFSNVPPGEYTLSAKLQGFQDAEIPLTVGATAVPHLRIKMKVAQVSDKVTVSANTQVLLAEENNNAFQMNGHLLMNMPTKDGDILAVPSLFLDNSMLGATGAKLIVDGVEIDQVDLPAPSIKDVVVNRNPFSAEFGRPGKGRLEITTRKGVHGRYRGTISALYRTSDLYARNAFAVDKPHEERKLVEGEVDGPIPILQSATFFLSGRYRNFDDNTVIDALTLGGPLRTNLGTPVDSTGLFGRVDFRINETHKETLFYRFRDKSQNNVLATNFDLPEHGTNTSNRANEMRMMDTDTISQSVLNQIRLGYKDETQSISSATNQPSILVLGSFSAGGAQVSRGLTERTGDLEDVASMSYGRHLFRFGGGIRQRFFRAFDASNFGGTFTFASLTDFQNNTPFLFTVNTGSPATSFSWTENYTFFQDDMHLRHNFALLVGMRQEFQTSVPYSQNLCPRVAVAYSPGSGDTVIRAGVGVFYDREPYNMIEDSRLYDGNSIVQTVLQNPVYPNPLGPASLTGATHPLPSIMTIAPNLRFPYLVHGSVLVERHVGHGQNYVTLEVGTVRGVELYRMRDVNAPFPGTTVRPNPNFVRIDQFESSASSRGYSASLSYRGQWRKLQVMGLYALGRTLDSSSSMFSLPANDYNANADWARADYDRRQQLNVAGTYNLPRGFTSSFIFNAWSGLPFNIITGHDDNHDSVANDRPLGLWRNAGRGPGYFNIDLRLSRHYRLSKLGKREKAPTLEWAIDAFNALNHVNFKNFIGPMTSPFFAQADAANPPRQLQLSARFNF